MDGPRLVHRHSPAAMLRLVEILFPLARVTRERDVARERLACAEDRIAELHREVRDARAERDAAQARYHRLAEARLFREGALATPDLSPPTPFAARAGSPFGNLGALTNVAPATFHRTDDRTEAVVDDAG